MKPINVLSLFNGMSTGHQALVNIGIPVGNYYSSEIKSFAIELTQYHFPKTIQLGDVNNWKEWDIDWSSIDLLLSGSPCKDLSGAGKRKGIYGDNSGLFWRFIEILEHIKKVNSNIIFFQENVGSASKKDIGIMSRAMGIYPCRINSELVTAQQRDRYYWSNMRTRQTMFDLVTDIPQPKDRGIFLKDIIENGFVDRDKARAILESESRLNTDMKKLLRRYKTTGFGNVVYCVAQRGRGNGRGNYVQQYEVNKTQKSNTITLVDKDNWLFNGEEIRSFTKIELCRLQGFPDDYLNILSRNKAASLLGDGWTLPIIEHIFKYLPFNQNNSTLKKAI
ncbi:DNA cytosine methyltransferase [Tenacibaculum sp. C7A-26P2]|uniref:DNA cytosine methyltransferase n=1 Tax=Tenacibaculum sp. C7A-26P2 TaxID=3447504 RepID=UPI003F84257E